MIDKKIKLQAIGWRSYQLIKKKAMEQELSWSGLIISLSIAFFIVFACAGTLRLVYDSIQNNKINEARAKQLNTESFIQFGSLAKVFINQVKAASLDFKAVPIKDTVYVKLSGGQTSSQVVKLKNIGDNTWKASEISLETGPYLKTTSLFQTNTWLKFYRPVNLPKDVKPGQTIEIAFPIKAPTNLNETVQENFQLVRNERPISGSLVRFFITVSNISSSAANSQSNTTTAQNQIKSNTTVATPLNTTTAPTVDFCISLINDPASYQNCNTASKESPSDDGIAFRPLLTSEPIIRVGLFNSTNTQMISFNTLFDVYAGNNILFSGLAPNTLVSASFDLANRRYSATVNNIAKTAVLPLRFIPRDNLNGVATLMNYQAQSGSSSDNRFRGTIEMRYTEPAKKVWLINELPIESYLKGLAETTNYSPVNFQKVMVTAARSYALYHYLRGIEYGLTDASTKHADDHFHIDAYYDQVYRGYNSELRMSSLSSAIDATRGITVTYAGKPVVTPYFSNSDGRTRDWTEVWGGTAKPWLKSVAVPQDVGKTLFGHGVGLSARGALLMVNSGTTWQNTLKYFYTGIDLIKIY